MRTSTLPRQQMKKLLASQNEIKAWVKDNGCLVIGVGMLKGGTGKTTMTIFFALYLAVILGLKVLVIDTDNNSQSIDNWYKVREARVDDEGNPEPEKVPFDLVTYDCKTKAEDDPDLDDVIDSFRDTYDVILVDSGGAGKEEYWELCKSAHMVFLPFAPSGYEWNRIAPTAKTAARGGKANEARLKVFVCMVKCTRRNTLAADARPVVEAIMAAKIDGDIREKIDIGFVGEEFEISDAPEYPRSWDETPRRTDLEEAGHLFRHGMKAVIS
ncbi:ParA family protein [Streptomyces sp. NPDC021080]|uniref:ParA family protein n=1 Tax=Streptomyces sp. NPDC021080 TaxID=3365110 RepID=UPI00379EFE2B